MEVCTEWSGEVARLSTRNVKRGKSQQQTKVTPTDKAQVRQARATALTGEKHVITAPAEALSPISSS